MAREYTDKEAYYIRSIVDMLEDSLEIVGSIALVDLQTELETMSEEETLARLTAIRKNIYSFLKGYPERLEQEYEVHKADPKVIAQVENMMKAEMFQEVDDFEVGDYAEYFELPETPEDGEDNGNLQ